MVITMPNSSSQSLPVESSHSPEIPEEETLPVKANEIGGRDGPEPTRYGDWEKNGRCIDF
jgi:hypothetical protein